MLSDGDRRRWYDAACRRISVRRYLGPPDEAQVPALTALAGRLASGGVRIALFPQAGAIFGRGLLGRSTTGVTFGAGFVVEADTPVWCAGYIGEAFVLACTDLGLGTCWMRGTFSRKPAREQACLRPGEKLVAVTPVGLPLDGALLPLGDDARTRKSITKLTGLTDAAFEALPNWQRAAILCARGAPSAFNLQPWTFSPTADGLLLTPGRRPAPDTGIAMFHIELAAAVHGFSGRWTQQGHVWQFSLSLPEN